MIVKRLQTLMRFSILRHTRLGSVLFAMLLMLATGGCWEEIQYEPKTSPAAPTGQAVESTPTEPQASFEEE